jgi:tripartite-type tricarboxylate transporter receptor subunit TctC
MNKKISRRAIVAGLSALATVPAAAQPAPWPNRPITLMHGFGAVGNADVVGRLVAERLAALAGIPDGILKRLNTEVPAVLAEPNIERI